MRRVKQRIFCGAVCEQIIYNIGDSADIRTAKPRKPRFENEEDRAAHREAISRKKNERLINANFSPASLYSTLTFDLDSEVHTVAECKRERDNFYRRILYKYPAAKIYLVYGKGKHTGRFHLHMISDGVPEEEIGKLWGRGSVIDVKPLRKHNYYKNESGQLVDHGQDYTALANYLFDHWREEFGGHRWKASRTCRMPKEKKVNADAFEPMCNPIAQAEFLNSQETEFNIALGPCASTARSGRRWRRADMCWRSAGRRSTDINIINMYVCRKRSRNASGLDAA